ncbi:ABC transporter ATP-binding protein (plasmid) [Rhodococcus sp. BH4]|uniref:ABC transporter ATP-binding protein n=1 Tax=Rhodococcus sp. BH4 TaxID=1807790 RepID=UPI0009C26E33|nr:ATP-binding cassette domain-containing protein [Rhodococcus sp. BH4]ARE37743.1 ABC transporter ATP-binding protein [Rhodococcus sp. BH4]
MTAVIAGRKLTAGYGPVPAVVDIDIEVNPGEVVALLGANGAGKTTTLMALAGAVPVSSGDVLWDGLNTHAPLSRRARMGMSLVTEERSTFAGLTVRQNLRIAHCEIEEVVRQYPELAGHLERKVGLLSGGQQQILALARALSRKPHALLADELSLGLAPQIVSRLLAAVRTAADQGVAVLLVEQHVHKALKIADRVCILRQGRIDWTGTVSEAQAMRSEIEESYLTGRKAGGSNESADLAR